MKTKISVLLCLLMTSWTLTAGPILVNTQNWISGLSPSSNKESTNDIWLRTGLQTPTKLGNSSGSLVSDFTLNGDFEFTGNFKPTYATNSSCYRENTCDDDDILGLVFGWQDASNHYRLGWSQGDGSNSSGVKDITGKTGLFLVKEENGRSNTIAHWSSDFWIEEVSYLFSVKRIAAQISFEIIGLVQQVAGIQQAAVPTTTSSDPFGSVLSIPAPPKIIQFSVDDSTFTTGKVGVYTESQTAEFSNMAVTVPDTQTDSVVVPAPATFGLVVLALIALVSIRKKNII